MARSARAVNYFVAIKMRLLPYGIFDEALYRAECSHTTLVWGEANVILRRDFEKTA
jgi:hypothetical protein